MKRALIAIVALTIVIVVSAPYTRPWLDRARLLYGLATEPPPAHVSIPVKDVTPRRLANSWGNARSGGREHQGIDIFAPKGTPVLSATRGFVTRVGTNTLGGQVVWVLGPGLEWHYYAHLDRYGGFHPGDIVHAGDVLGYVGTTGNARGGPPHLHYGIYGRSGAENPYPRLAGS
jgi:peptidoglycan LD-endopeptidase LytH